ncbi:hypothetical protein GCM10010160_17200 [Acrocarpospora corrugata]
MWFGDGGVWLGGGGVWLGRAAGFGGARDWEVAGFAGVGGALGWDLGFEGVWV